MIHRLRVDRKGLAPMLVNELGQYVSMKMLLDGYDDGQLVTVLIQRRIVLPPGTIDTMFDAEDLTDVQMGEAVLPNTDEKKS